MEPKLRKQREEGMTMLLDNIRQVNDIKNVREEDLAALAEEIRQFLIEKISVTGGDRKSTRLNSSHIH